MDRPPRESIHLPSPGRYAAATGAALALFALGAALYARTLGYTFLNSLRAIFTESLLGGILPVCSCTRSTPRSGDSMAWISARKDPPSTLFLLLATAGYVRARRDVPRQGRS